MAEPKVTRRKLSDYKPAQVNPNAGSEYGLSVIENSLGQFGAGRSLLADQHGEMIAGSHTLQAAANAGFEDVIEIETDGKTLVVVKRTDLDLSTDVRAQGLQVVDNRSTEVGYVPDNEVIAPILARLADEDAKLVAAAGYNAESVQEVLDTLHNAGDGDLGAWDVPDALWPTDNEWGVPLLDITMQADALDMPVERWGKVSRKSKMSGTYHFYTEDYKFDALWDDPTDVVNSRCVNVIEPNFSTDTNMPRAVALWGIYRKRWLSRYWQSRGIRIIVDLHVSASLLDMALMGVPASWSTYCNRGYGTDIEHLDTAYQIALAHAGKPILYIVYGGGKAVSALCKKRGWVYVMEDAHKTEGRDYG